MPRTTTRLRRCAGLTRFGIAPHEAPITDFPKQPSRKDGLGLICAVHWKAYVKGLAADRKARKASGQASAIAAPTAATTKRERRRTPMAHVPKPEPTRVRKALQTLAATETLAGTAYTEAIGSPEVQAALETVNEHDTGRDLTAGEAEAVEAIAAETDPRSEDEVRAQEADAA